MIFIMINARMSKQLVLGNEYEHFHTLVDKHQSEAQAHFLFHVQEISN